MTIEEKEKFLLMSNYSAKHIMKILECGRTTASKIMNECRSRYNGSVIGRNVITAKSFWQREGTTIEEELRLLSVAKQYAK
jgi:hypothetical protein